MDTRRIICAVLAAACLSGCGSKIGSTESVPEQSQETELITTTAAPDDSEPAAVTTVPEVEVEAEPVTYKAYSKTVQAEKGTLSGKAKVKNDRPGFEGEGYVSVPNAESGCAVKFKLPEAQYYNITLTAAADKNAVGTLSAGGRSIGEFDVSAEAGFGLMTFSNIFLEKGETEFSVSSSSKSFDLDSVTIEASKDIKNLKIKPLKSELVNKNASDKAKELYSYICEGYGTRILTGQHDTWGTLTETRKIYELTGRFPAIRGGDLMPYTQAGNEDSDEISRALEWAADGGIVSYMCHWCDPSGKTSSCYADETDFDLSAAVTKEDIALLSPEEIEKLRKDGKISDQCAEIIAGIDLISEKLTVLRDAEVPVLWRPLHEASNGYFWWGRDKASYKWLWKLLYKRQTEYHKLDNLIWVWSAQSADWYVGDKYCDIVSCDIYGGSDSGQAERLLALREISSKKPAVISECGNLPSISRIAGENAMWAYIMQWGGSYLLNEDATLNEENNSLDSLIEFYNNDLTTTRDELS